MAVRTRHESEFRTKMLETTTNKTIMKRNWDACKFLYLIYSNMNL